MKRFFTNIRKSSNINTMLLLVFLLIISPTIAYFYWRIQSLKSQQTSIAEPTKQIQESTPTAIPYWQISLPDTQTVSDEWNIYEDNINGFKFKYPPSKYSLKSDDYEELNRREPNNTLRELLGSTKPPKVIKAIRLDDGNYSGEFYFTPFSLWVFDNPERLNGDEWYKKYNYFPMLVSSDRNNMGTITIDGEPINYSYNYFAFETYNFHISRGNKIFLFHVETIRDSQKTGFGPQILSTFQFLPTEPTPVFDGKSISVKIRNPFYSPNGEGIRPWYDYTFSYDYRTGDIVRPIKNFEKSWKTENLYSGIEISRDATKVTITVPFEGVRIIYKKVPEPAPITQHFSSRPVYRMRYSIDFDFNPQDYPNRPDYLYVSNYQKDKCGEYHGSPIPACSSSSADGYGISCRASAENVVDCDDIISSLEINPPGINF